MNEKEVAEIRRRFHPEKTNIPNIRGCYVNEKREIVSEFVQSVPLMAEEDKEKFLGILKKTLSGTLEKNLLSIEFTTQQVVDSPEHQLLMRLRGSHLKDDDAVQQMFQHVLDTVGLEGNYLVLLAYDTYDVPYRSTDGERQDDASSEAFSYILCSVCPVKLSKPALSYYIYENEFHSRTADWLVSAPELGFMFPTFDDRSTNIYNALFYTKDITLGHEQFIDTVFKSAAPVPAAVQKETFQSILSETLEDDCCMEVVQSMHERLQIMIEDHKEAKEGTKLMVSKSTMKDILKSSGVSEEHIEAFDERYDAEFGADTSLSPKNIIDKKQMEVVTPEVKIVVNAGCQDLIETRIINGQKYIMIRAESGVELNGVPIKTTE